jgi:two-component system chemotaxis response regulator CheY
MAKRIMIVDDSATVRHVLRSTLDNAGFDVIETVSGQDALDKLEGEKLDMMITDLNMPAPNGIELIKIVRKNQEYRFIPIIMLTTESAEEKRQEGKTAGASSWIVKPFKPEQLLKMVEVVLG